MGDAPESPSLAPAQLMTEARADAPSVVKAESLQVVRAAGVESLVPNLLSLKFLRGTLKTSQLAWYKVEFSEAFSKTPTLIAMGMFRAGWPDLARYQSPQLDNVKLADQFGATAKDFVKQKVDIPILGSALGGLIYWEAWVLGWLWAWAWNVATPMVVKLAENSLNSAAPLLYNFSNRPAMKLTTAEVRSVTAQHFEILGYPDGQFQWFAVGDR